MNVSSLKRIEGSAVTFCSYEASAGREARAAVRSSSTGDMFLEGSQLVFKDGCQAFAFTKPVIAPMLIATRMNPFIITL